MAQLFECIIHAFEPVPKLFATLQSNTRRFTNVFCHQLALSSKTGKAKFYVSSGSSDGSSSLLEPKEHLQDHPDVLFKKTIDVITITLDDWAAQHGIDHIDFLWLDMQGAELAM